MGPNITSNYSSWPSAYVLSAINDTLMLAQCVGLTKRTLGQRFPSSSANHAQRLLVGEGRRREGGGGALTRSAD